MPRAFPGGKEVDDVNGHERTVTALQRQQPDRIPIMELYIHPKVVEGLCPGGDLLAMVERMDLDGVTVQSTLGPPKTGRRPARCVNEWGIRFGRTTEAYHPVRKGGPGGGYIMMSSNSLHSSVKPENYRAMVAACRRYGEYPLDMGSLS